MDIWTSEKAHAWYEKVKWQVGLNFVPSNAINPTEMWQEETYDEATIRREVAFASSVGYNSMRVFLPFIVWENEGEKFLKRFDRFLSIAAENGMTVMPVIFDDCEFDHGQDPYLGKQADPIPGVLNGRWTACPGFTIADDPTRVADLRAYVHAVVGRYREDPRILVWDMYNEPGNFSRTYKALPLLANAFSWANGVPVDRADDAILMSLSEQKNAGGASYVGVIASVDFSAEEFLQSAVYGNTDVLLRSLHNVGKEYTPEGLTIKPFSSQDISTITTRQMLLWTVGLSVVPALVIAGAGAVILIRRRRA